MARATELRTYPAQEARPVGSDFNPEETDRSNNSFAGGVSNSSVDEGLLPPRRQEPSIGDNTPKGPGMLADAKSWDQSRPIYNPRGAPSDAVPALSRLEARISFAPLYMYNYASTLYACVSFLPWNLAEQRARINILV
jgi:hypothetical protein